MRIAIININPITSERASSDRRRPDRAASDCAVPDHPLFNCDVLDRGVFKRAVRDRLNRLGMMIHSIIIMKKVLLRIPSPLPVPLLPHTRITPATIRIQFYSPMINTEAQIQMTLSTPLSIHAFIITPARRSHGL